MTLAPPFAAAPDRWEPLPPPGPFSVQFEDADGCAVHVHCPDFAGAVRTRDELRALHASQGHHLRYAIESNYDTDGMASVLILYMEAAAVATRRDGHPRYVRGAGQTHAAPGLLVCTRYPDYLDEEGYRTFAAVRRLPGGIMEVRRV